MELKGNVAVVAGGETDLGAAVCMRLAREGAKVALTYGGAKRAADQIVDAIEALSGDAFAEKVDVVEYDAVSEFMKRVIGKWGKLDIVVNAVATKDTANLFEMTKEQFNHVLDVNLKGCFNLMRSAAPVFKEQEGPGRVVNVASVAPVEGWGSVNDVAARSGVIGLTLAAARELGPYDVTVNAVAPGLVETASIKSVPAEAVDRAVSRSVLRRLARPEEVADVILFLCSSKARQITGEVIRVDGGQHL
jgi:3-oxoacyl-[acyl-carrier protein] reductase